VSHDLNPRPVRAVDATPFEDALWPDDRITCGKCARTSGNNPNDEKRCPRQPKYPSEHRHRCWYFLPVPTLEDQRTGEERYATNDLAERALIGWIRPKGRRGPEVVPYPGGSDE
jgi:hypothetical protein